LLDRRNYADALLLCDFMADDGVAQNVKIPD